MKRYLALLLALVMVVGLIPTTAVLAEENAAPVLADENFDDVALEFPSVDTVPGVGEYTAAQIKADPSRDGYALWAGDEEGAIVPALTYTFDSTSNVTVEFDVNVSEKNALNVLRLYNNDYTNFQKVAISLNFSNQGLRYYNGSAWTAYNADVTLPVNEWVKIRIELIPGKDGEAKIFLDDVNVLIIPGSELQGTMANDANSVNGIYFASNKADRTFYLDNLKIDAAPYQATETPTSSTGFEAMEVDAAPSDPIINASLAKVVAITNEESTNNVLFLNDDSATASAGAGLTVKDSQVLKTTFKYKGVKGALQMYITDGGRATANTAYFLQFSGKNVQYYDGAAWQTLVTLDYFLTSWTNISIEADMESAKIYIKGELVAEAPRTGGSYGSNVTNVLDSVFFAIGGAASVDSNCYLDDVSLSGNTRNVTVTPYVGTDFENMTVDAAPTAPVVDNLQTVIISRVNGSGKLAAQVCDLVTAGAGRMRLALPEKTDKMVVEFDLVAWTGAMQFAITNGGQSTANMAYWLQIQAKNVQYYNGSKWETLKVMDAALAAGWHKIRIEADLEKADLYIDGVLMGTAARCGGSYGTNVKTNFDSIVFICGGSTVNTYKYIVDNVSVTGATYNVIVTPELIEENFDSYAPSASVENVEQIVASSDATIVANPVGEGNVILLNTETSTAGGSIDLGFDLVDSYVLEYDALIPTSANDIGMQIHAGRGGNRLAYILMFNRAYGLRALSGNAETKESTWNNLEETATKLAPNEWHKIRVEVNTGDEQAASVYLDGQLIATTSLTYNRANDVNGAYIYSGGKGQNVYIDNLKVTIPESEDEGIDGVVDTEVGLMLEQDVTIDEMTIEPETVLDLNGYTLTVNNLVVYGSIIDTSENNAGKLIAENVIFNNMGYMPVYDSANGWYKFYEYTLENLGVRGNADGSVTYGFAINFVNAEAYGLLATSGSGVTVNMNLAWGENSQLFAFNAALVQQYAALQAKYPALRAAMMLTVSGLDTLEAGQTVSVTPVVEAAGVADSGEAMVYTVS